MKKLLSVLIVFVMVAAMFGTAAAAMNVAADDTTKVWTGNKDIAMSFDTFFLDGVSHMDMGWGNDGGAAGKLTSNPVTVGDHQNLSMRGWAGIKGDPAITDFGYRINGGEAVYDAAFKVEAEGPVKDAGGEYRMLITVPIAGLTEPTLITAVAKGDNGQEYDFIEFSVNGQYGDAPASDYAEMPIDRAAGGVGVWVQKGSETATVKFTTAGAFKGISFNSQYWASNASATGPEADWKVELYKFAYNTENTLEQAPAASKELHSIADNVPVFEFNFDEQEAGTYIVKVSITNPEFEQEIGGAMKKPYVVLPSITNPDETKFEFSGKAFNLSLYGEKVEGDFYVANPEETEVPGDDPGEILLGDVNGDGNVNNKDVIALFKYVSEDEIPDFVVEAADINEDGKINNKDVYRLFKLVSETPSGPEDTYLRHALDRLMIGGQDVSGQEAAAMKAGTEITILGWAVFTDGLKEMAYEVDGERFACEDNFRDRADVAAAFSYPEEYGLHCGFGTDSKFMSCTGSDAIESGEHTLSIIAIANGGFEKVIKTITLTVTDEEPPAKPAITKTCVDGAPQNNGIFSPGGWTGANYKITKFGYTIDGGEPIFDHIRLQELDASDPVKLDANAGPNGVRFFADIPLTELTAGDHVIKLVCQVEDVDETVLELGAQATFTVQGTIPVVKLIVDGSVSKAEVKPSNVEISMNESNLVVKTTGGDPWFAAALPDIAVDEFESFTIKFKTNSAIGGNNTYLADGNLNFTGESGAWKPHGMNGMEDNEWHEVTYNLADFPYFAGKTLKYVRFTAPAAVEGVMEIESITFKKAGEAPEITVFGYSADWYAYAGAFLSQSGNCDKLVKENLQTYELHSDPNSDIVGFYGWAALNNSKITTFGIKIDGGEMIDSPLARIQNAGLDRTAELANAGIVNGEAFWTVFFYTSAGAGKHNVAIYAIDELGGEHELFNYDYEAVSVDPVQWLCDTTNTEVLLPGLWAFPATPGQYCTLTFKSAYTFNGFCMMIYGNPEGTVADVSLLDKYGTELEKQQFTQVGDAAPTIVFSKAYPEGTYTLKFTIVSGAGETNWFVIGTGDPNPAMPVTVGGNFATNENTRAGIYAFLTGAPHITVASLKNMSFDNIVVDGENKTPGGSAGAYIEANPIVDAGTLGVRGWAWIANGSIGQFGYSIDGAAPVFADAYTDPRADVQAAFGVTADVANGFNITGVDVSSVTGGEHTFTIVVKATDGTIIDVVSFKFYKEYKLLNVSYDNLKYDDTLLKEGSVDKWIYGLEDKSVLDFNKGAVKNVTVRGWVRISENVADIAGFGYSIDGGKVVTGEFLEDRAAELAGAGFTGAQGFTIVVPVEALEAGQHSIDAYLIAADGTQVKIVKDRSTADVVDIRQVGVTFNVLGTVEQLYALGDNEDLPGGPHTLTGKITKVVTAYSDRYENVTVDIVVDGAEDKPVRCYRIKGDGADKIGVGDTITVTGELTHFVNTNNNVYEFKADSTLDSWKSDYFTETFDGEDFDTEKLKAWGGYKLEGGKLHLGWSGNWVESSPAMYTKLSYTNYALSFKMSGDARDCYYGFGLRTKGDGSMMNGGRFSVPSAAETSNGIAIDIFGAANSTLGTMVGITFCNGGANGDAPCAKVAYPEGFDGKTEAEFKVVDKGDTITITVNEKALATITLSGLTDGKYTQATVVDGSGAEVGQYAISILAEGQITFYQRNDHVTVDDLSITRA